MNASDRDKPGRRAGLPGLALALALALVLPSVPAGAFLEIRTERAPQERPLSAADIERYRTIFALQADGDWKEADRIITRLQNEMLLGHVLAERYLHPRLYRSRYRELAAWLERYADHPDARQIYELALKRKPRRAAGPHRPVEPETSLAAEAPLHTVYLYESKKNLKQSARRKVRRLKRRIRRYIGRTYLTRAERIMERRDVRRLFDRFERDNAYAGIAAGWLYLGKPDKAFEIAGAVADRSGKDIPTAHWTAGLAAWRLDRTIDASRHFATLANADEASSWNRSAGAYWAARVFERAQDPAEAHRWLTVAAGYPFTFYGLLARHRLGLQLDAAFPPIGHEEAAMRRLLSTRRGARAAALIQVGRTDLAERELSALADWRNPATTRAILALTQSAELPRLGLEIARRLLADEGSGWSQRELGAVMYPVPRWRPAGGFSVDRALIYAFIRQESSFDPQARSPAGARGLMQLMPGTASGLDRRTRYRGRTRKLLYDPARNLALAQLYMTRLLDSRRVRGDLMRLSVAYNAGPGNLTKWEQRTRHDGDPLLFLETLPSLESRLFVERIMTNLWIYRLRLGQPAPTLTALAEGRWPTYQAIDRPPEQIAADH